MRYAVKCPACEGTGNFTIKRSITYVGEDRSMPMEVMNDIPEEIHHYKWCACNVCSGEKEIEKEYEKIEGEIK